MKQVGYLNKLRVCATGGVIMIHVFSSISGYYGAVLSQYDYYSSMILRNLWQWSVPTFVMISGAIFLDSHKDVTIKQLLSKYVPRIMLALFVFGVPYAFLEIFFNSGYKFDLSQVLTAFWNVFLGRTWDHMWYLYMILGLYLLIPLFKTFTKYADISFLKYTLITLFVFTSLVPLIEEAFSIKFGFYLPISSVFAFYLLLGHYIHTYEVNIDRRILYSVIMLYIIYVVIMAMNDTFVNADNGGRISFLGYGSPIVAIVTGALFCLAQREKNTSKIFGSLSPLCFAIYLIHPVFINFLYKFVGLTPENYRLVTVVPVVLILTVSLSLLFAFLARKIGVVRRYIL